MANFDLPYTPVYDYIRTEEEARKALDFLDKFQTIAVDTETDGKDPLVNRVITVQIGTPHKAYIFDVRKVGAELLKPMLESEDKLKLLQFAKFDYQMIRTNFDIRIRRVYDTMLAEQMLHLGMFIKSSLEELIRKYLGFDINKELAQSFVDRYNAALTREQLDYAANDVLTLFDIYNQQLAQIKENSLERACKLEFDCVAPVAEMELNGIKLDEERWLGLSKEIQNKRDDIEEYIIEYLKETTAQQTLFGVAPVNLSSPAQLLSSLRKLGFELENTSEAELKKYKSHELFAALLKHREYNKAVTTYGPIFLKNIHHKTGRIHSRFRQLVSTGRFACSSKYGAGLQQIKKESDFRHCFIAEEGNDIITSDYSQMELRIIAAYSKDPAWLEAFETGKDLHSTTAAVVFGGTPEEAKADDDLPDTDPNRKGIRDKAKAINFGLAYGMSEFGLAARLGIDVDDATKMIEKYFEACPGVKRFLEEAAKSAVSNKYAETISGRKRFFKMPEFSDPDYKAITRSIERKGKNTPIQGSNADVTKQAMIYIQKKIEEHNLSAKIIHSVHDEVVLESKKEETNKVVEIVEDCMEKAWYDFFDAVSIKTDTVVRPYWSKK